MRIALLSLALIPLLSACVHRHMTENQAYTQRDYDECKADADSINDPPRNSNNFLWKTYFERCMKQRGYTEERLHKMWY